MSWGAVAAVLKKRVGNSSLKLVLLHFSERMNEETKLAWPSVTDSVQRTELDRKTVLKKIEELAALRILVDTGKRTGKTKQIVVWKVDLDQLKNFQRPGKTQKPMVPNAQLSEEEIEEFAEAAVFIAERVGKKITSLDGFKFKIRDRIGKAGTLQNVPKADIDGLEKYRQVQKRPQEKPTLAEHLSEKPRRPPDPVILAGLREALQK